MSCKENDIARVKDPKNARKSNKKKQMTLPQVLNEVLARSATKNSDQTRYVTWYIVERLKVITRWSLNQFSSFSSSSLTLGFRYNSRCSNRFDFSRMSTRRTLSWRIRISRTSCCHQGRESRIRCRLLVSAHHRQILNRLHSSNGHQSHPAGSRKSCTIQLRCIQCIRQLCRANSIRQALLICCTSGR